MAAARLIAQDGADYSTAKRKAAIQILGGVKTPGNVLPDNAQIEEQVHQYNALFLSESQPARLLHLRTLAQQLMAQLQQFNPYLTGAALHGTAGEHSDIHLQLFTESAKDVGIYLLNKNIHFDVSEVPHFNQRCDPVETLSFMWQQEGIHLTVYHQDDLRNMTKKGRSGKIERLNSAGVAAIISESGT